jgi:hypothetical protein
VRSRNHCCRGNSISSTYSECVSLALVSKVPHILSMFIKSGLLSTFFQINLKHN